MTRRNPLIITACFALCALHCLLAGFWPLALVLLVMVPLAFLDFKREMQSRGYVICCLAMVLLLSLMLAVFTSQGYFLALPVPEILILLLVWRKK